MYIPVSWLNYLCNNFFLFFLPSTFVHSCTLGLCCIFFYSILYRCLLTFFYLIHSWLVFFIHHYWQICLVRGIWNAQLFEAFRLSMSLLWGVFMYQFASQFARESSVLVKNSSLSRCHVSLLFKLSVLWVIEWDFFKVLCLCFSRYLCLTEFSGVFCAPISRCLCLTEFIGVSGVLVFSIPKVQCSFVPGQVCRTDGGNSYIHNFHHIWSWAVSDGGMSVECSKGINSFG